MRRAGGAADGAVARGEGARGEGARGEGTRPEGLPVLPGGGSRCRGGPVHRFGRRLRVPFGRVAFGRVPFSRAPGVPDRRNTELALLVLAVAVPVYAYAETGLALHGEVPAGLWAPALGLGLLAGLGHLVVRRFARHADPLLLPIATLLNGLGLVLVWRLDQSPRLRFSAGFEVAAPRQLLYSALGMVLFGAVLVVLRDHRTLQRYTYRSMAVALVLLLLPLVPGLGSEVHGARIWIALAGHSMQPAEFAKIVIAVFFAGYLVAKRDALASAGRRLAGLPLPRARDLGPILAVWALSVLILVFETDLGTSLLFFGLFVVMLYTATERMSWIVCGLLMAAAGAAGVGSFEPHVRQRVRAWLHPMGEYLKGRQGLPGHSEQSMQALWAFGSGGLAGTGLGRGDSDLIGFAANSDFILATVGEELGMAGLVAVLLLYALVVERGMRTALATRDPFGKLLAGGLSAAFALQVFVVAGGVLGLIPLTGMTLPFVAYGGSSVAANWALVGILVRISDTARRPVPREDGAGVRAEPHEDGAGVRPVPREDG
ncbi:putative cell division membrane protein [Actinacidiphila reveromycinica]|uniref:Putative cell division membrane protein n=1 Tax=Actinacidiphila reveromycinica TaxID=659352 RepID=A0A7U3UZL3_9ACTN|nr:FtsW/RodA/SpoVE family cell cycle protein [Streptomyces sp. SN-593]BBB01509.1 putative cell division membrane protein [Streptomyces sp. SN-593]